MSNLSAIGFAASSEDEFLRTVGAALERAAPPPDLGASAAHYLWFRDASGAALGLCAMESRMVAADSGAEDG
ncbi:hypothetical protein [Sorangium sp. So ce861]|uniref:hypothetical protein n=1 Tax=Sorangium sp. So ce861 TaxID=3133323 RepID=UPI003F5D714C